MTSFRGMLGINCIKLNVAVFEFNEIFVDGFWRSENKKDVFLIACCLLVTPLSFSRWKFGFAENIAKFLFFHHIVKIIKFTGLRPAFPLKFASFGKESSCGNLLVWQIVFARSFTIERLNWFVGCAPSAVSVTSINSTMARMLSFRRKSSM
ncbi:Hypothetical predicted protein [Paramuricea clavata]|uniref:Uncharacterized protein n=1 Tax=Paramuricea clavata TaxID=317549 RepID=A0A6S7FZ61_PARCT|nr:Hypothetical predicted protein [Paramuricea clavata]